MKKKYINIGIFVVTFSILMFCFYLSKADIKAYGGMGHGI